MHDPATTAPSSTSTSSSGAVGGTTGANDTARPNIVFVLTDDLATNLVQYMPHVLALQQRGMTFTNYTVSDSLCCPSRASIFTGEFPHDTKVLTNGGRHGGFPTYHRRHEESHSFAAQIQAQGYRTALMGKFMNGYYATYPTPAKKGPLGIPGHTIIPAGWTEWDGVGWGYDEYNFLLNHNHTIEYHGTKPADYLTTVVQNHATSFISDSARAKKPFLLEVATFAPHLPATPAPEDLHKFNSLRAPRTAAFDRLPRHAPKWLARRAPLTVRNTQAIDEQFRTRVRSVQAVDRMIGTLEDTLRKTGQAGNTDFVFSSDNGLHMGEYRLDPGKLTAFDTDIHVPLVVAGPQIAPGSVNDDVVENIDLAPTFEGLTGAQVPEQTDGRSLVPLLHGAHPTWRTLATVEHKGPATHPGDPDRQTFAEGNPPTYVAIRSKAFTYVRYDDGEREYYDRRTDPSELDNRYGQLSPSRIAQLNRQVDALHGCHGEASCWTAGRPSGT